MASAAVPAKRAGRGRTSSAEEALSGWVAISPWIIGFLIFTAGPILASLYLSFGMDDYADYEAHRTLRLDPKSAVALAVLDKLKEKVTAPPGAPGG